MPFSTHTLHQLGEPDYIINYAAQSHVDRSITHPAPFIQNNTLLAINMLEYARSLPGLQAFVQISTDEVYGPAPQDVNHPEWAPILPSNPYSASKAAQEAIAISYWRTFSVPLIITNTMNLFGEYQDSEKFVAKCIDKIRAGETLTIHAGRQEGKWISGSRFYLHARNMADAIMFLLHQGSPTLYNGKQESRPDRYNIVGEREVSNLEMAELIAEALSMPLYCEMVDFHSSRPGHDLRYALDGTKIAALGWAPPISFETGLKRTVEWEQ